MKKGMLFVVVLLIANSFAWADSGNFIGIRAGFYTEAEKPFIGAEYLAGVAPSVDFNPNIEYVFMENATYLTMNLDAHYDFYSRSRAFFYFGGGLAIQYFKVEGIDESDTNTGLNLLFGMGVARGPVIPYIQAKAVLMEDNEFVIGFGLRF